MAGNVFEQVAVRKPNYSWFDLSNDHKTTLNMGYLIPVNVQECLPSDKFVFSTEAMFRMMPMIAPIMHKVEVFIHHFYVPNRIIWPNPNGWEEFISPANATSETIVPPYLNSSSNTMNVTVGSLADYLGIPIGTWADDLPSTFMSALPFAAYQKIWWDYYRDQNMQDMGVNTFEEYIDIISGQVSETTDTRLGILRQRAWEHDYFTSCLPWSQKGDPVTLPIDATVNIDIPVTRVSGYAPNIVGPSSGTPYSGDQILHASASGGELYAEPINLPAAIDPNGSLHVDGSTSDITVSTTINDLRAAYALQIWLEKNARAGTRYTESLLVHFGVRSSDARLQRPEYIGGTRSIMAISEVLQTSASDTTATPQGNMAGHGVTIVGGAGNVSYYCEEHGLIMSILSIRPKTAYHQGLPRLFSKIDRFQYAWPEFAQLGEDAVTRGELVLTIHADSNAATFGYLPRYSEYRYSPSRVTGDFHTTLNYWSMHRTFSLTAPPTLNDAFIMCDATDRIFAVEDPSTRHIIGHIVNSMMVRRPLPRYGTPAGLI